MKTMSIEAAWKSSIYQIYMVPWQTSCLAWVIRILFTSVVIGLVILILHYHLTIFKSGQKCKCRTILISHHITSSHHKPSMPPLPQAPGPMVIPMLFSSILTIAKFGHRVVFYISYAYLICIDWLHEFGSGHHIVQLQLIFRVVPSRKAPYAPGTDLFLTYAWHFDIVPQPNPAANASLTQKGLHPMLHFSSLFHSHHYTRWA